MLICGGGCLMRGWLEETLLSLGFKLKVLCWVIFNNFRDGPSGLIVLSLVCLYITWVMVGMTTISIFSGACLLSLFLLPWVKVILTLTHLIFISYCPRWGFVTIELRIVKWLTMIDYSAPFGRYIKFWLMIILYTCALLQECRASSHIDLILLVQSINKLGISFTLQ